MFYLYEVSKITKCTESETRERDGKLLIKCHKVSIIQDTLRTKNNGKIHIKLVEFGMVKLEHWKESFLLL